MKILPAPFLALLIILLSIEFYLDPADFLSNGIFFLLMLAVAMVLFAWHSMRMKSVSIEGQNLIVSGYLKSTVVPLSDIQYVHYSPAIGLVIIRLKSPSAFGETIAFMPTWGNAMLATFGQHSIVEELREMARAASTRFNDAI